MIQNNDKLRVGGLIESQRNNGESEWNKVKHIAGDHWGNHNYNKSLQVILSAHLLHILLTRTDSIFTRNHRNS